MIPVVNFINSFLYKILAPKKLQSRTFQLCHFWHQNIGPKSARKMLMKLTPGISIMRVSLLAVFLSVILLKDQISLQNVFLSANSIVTVKNSWTYLLRIMRLTCTCNLILSNILFRPFAVSFRTICANDVPAD
jgi:hypothetical protein